MSVLSNLMHSPHLMGRFSGRSLARGVGAGFRAGGGIASMIQANRNAEFLEASGDVALADRRRENAAILARERTRRATRGIQLDSGSALDVDLALTEALERRALREVHPFSAAASAQRSRGRLSAFEGAVDAVGSFIGSKADERLRRRPTHSGSGASSVGLVQ